MIGSDLIVDVNNGIIRNIGKVEARSGVYFVRINDNDNNNNNNKQNNEPIFNPKINIMSLHEFPTLK